MRFAAIDIGTNSTRLLVKEIHGSSYLDLVRDMKITRLGENLDKTRVISDKAALRTCRAIEEYKEVINKSNVEKVKTIGTEALRKAENSGRFQNMVKEKTGLEVEVIDGLEEARLSFLGVTYLQETHLDKNILIIDIGGGSTEFILGTKRSGTVFLESIDIGSVVLTENIQPGKKNIDEAIHLVKTKLTKTLQRLKDYKIFKVIGLAGTITTLASIDLGLVSYKREKIHLHCLSFSKIISMLKSFLEKDLEERKKIVGIDSRRADIIIAGTIILKVILEHLNIKKITVSENDILDGIIYSILDFC